MIKAIFCDFYGTLVKEESPIAAEVIKRIFTTSNATTPNEIVEYW